MVLSITNFIKQFWQAITVIILILITVGSLFPVEHLPAAPGSDKTHHFIAYCALMLPTALRRPKYWLAFALFFILWSGLIELIQPYVNRYGEWLDMLANTGGVFLAVIIAQAILWLAPTKHQGA
ncbi:VanZ family protein [Colwellia sp. M166]|uniref:VanZ family protein n=1 Tax=Colwellia sp. M166 TaxID=2583805 RepID=UPI00211E6F59|nr:VanZ family protein [Colwellia sp. M166]|tara:strand:- start:29981 stop:30352 length:372 start_codon:yes stop_codon:yes gene_type:complete